MLFRLTLDLWVLKITVNARSHINFIRGPKVRLVVILCTLLLLYFTANFGSNLINRFAKTETIGNTRQTFFSNLENHFSKLKKNPTMKKNPKLKKKKRKKRYPRRAKHCHNTLCRGIGKVTFVRL